MKTRLLHISLLLLVLVFSTGIFTACGTGTSEVNTSAPVSYVDQIGRSITLQGVPQRIVSLAPSNTEILFSLGLEDKIVGVSEYCDYPPAAKEKPNIGGYSTADVEKIVAAEPDVIFAEDMHVSEIVPALENLGQTVVVIDPRTLDEVMDSFKLIGDITGTSEKAAEIVDNLQARIKKITDKTSDLTTDQRPRVFYVMWHDPLMTVGSDTRINELIKIAGGVNLFEDTQGYPMIDLETLVDRNPQVLIAGTGMGEGADAPFTFIKTETRLAETDARKNGQVFEINTDLTGRPTERMIDALEQLAAMIHPELFQQ
jgi:iron complex transport system substrate-binding protein